MLESASRGRGGVPGPGGGVCSGGGGVCSRRGGLVWGVCSWGCVPGLGGVCSQGGSAPRGSAPREVSAPRGVCLLPGSAPGGGVSALGGIPACRHPSPRPVNINCDLCDLLL